MLIKLWRFFRLERIVIKLKQSIRRWLGLSEIFMGVDVGIRDQSCIVVISRLNDGSVRIIDCAFPSIIELDRFVRDCQIRYGIPDRAVYRDYPPSMKRS
jgi:hypothetical protein